MDVWGTKEAKTIWAKEGDDQIVWKYTDLERNSKHFLNKTAIWNSGPYRKIPNISLPHICPTPNISPPYSLTPIIFRI